MSKKEKINSQLEFIMKGLEKDLDSSFDKINNLIDSVFIIDSPIYKFSNPRLELAQIKVDQFHLIGQSKFQYNILQEVKSQTSLKIQEQLQFKLQSDSRYSDSFISSQINDLQEVNQIQSPKTSSNLKKFTYQIIEDNSIKEQQICFAITINKNCSKVAVGCEEQIKIYEFKQGMVKQTEVLNEHTSYVYTLNFIEKSNQLISGDVGGSIVIWSNYKNSQLNSLQTIKAHSNYLRCLILNSHEDLFITCSDDQTIKFWNLKSEWVCQQTITDHTGRVYQISLNDQENKLISCDQDNSILVIEYSKQSEKWIVIQKIKVDVYGFRLCNLMHVFEMNLMSKQFTKTKDITINQGCDDCRLFPQQFNKQKQILVNKHDQYVNIIRRTETNEFSVEQSIHFKTYVLFGQLSQDGEHFITWDDSSKEIQIRKFLGE